jgi:hypothetical protein
LIMWMILITQEIQASKTIQERAQRIEQLKRKAEELKAKKLDPKTSSAVPAAAADAKLKPVISFAQVLTDVAHWRSLPLSRPVRPAPNSRSWRRSS